MEFFSGKTAIVTGAGSGVGRGLAEELARRGAEVVLADQNKERLNSTVEAIIQGGGRAEGAMLDVADPQAVGSMINAVVEQHGRLDYLFNNAGIAVGGEVRDCNLEHWRKVLDVNLYGVIHGVDAAYPIMVRQGFGHIINTASIEGLVPFPGTAGYVASKYAVVGLSQSLRIEAEDLGVKVSVVCPGYIETNIFQDSEMVGLDRDKALGVISRMRGLSPRRCAEIILSGVERNKAIIIVTGTARFLWILGRISPWAVRFLMKMHLRKTRRDIRNCN